MSNHHMMCSRWIRLSLCPCVDALAMMSVVCLLTTIPAISLCMASAFDRVVQPQRTFSTNNATPIADSSHRVFTGGLGIYNNLIVMQISNVNGKISGNYTYTRHGKDLALKGEVDSVTGRGAMVETLDGEITGYFDFTLTDSGMTGTWRATPTAEGQPFDFQWLELSDDTYAKQAAKLTGFYCRTFESWVYVNGATPDAPPKEKAHDAWDWLRVRHVGGNVLAFHYRVMADNGHQGAIGGLAHMTSAGTAEFTAVDGLPGRPRGRLGFEFDGDSVTNTELEDCSDFRGARAHFDGTLKRADEHAVSAAMEKAATR